MDYTAGSSGQTAIEPSSTANAILTTPANSIKARGYATTSGSVGMNITTGGPHILLFERDQQLVGLLTSELQLAGYECHTARTAVEVFDAIARYPVRLVLVDLAQAAAARREFWVALDTQRRGRGVQVFTFHCTNIAGYGPSSDDVEERSHSVLADMEVDGMLGIMNMVNAIRSRIAVSNTSAMSRLVANAPSNPLPTAQITAPVSTVTSNEPQIRPYEAENYSASSSQSSPSSSTASPHKLDPLANPTDKIRAVIYPNQRSWSASRDISLTNGQVAASTEQRPMQETNLSSRNARSITMNQSAISSASPINVAAPEPVINGQTRRSTNETTSPNESGLAQLSRMLQEHRSPTLDELAQELGSQPNNPFQHDIALQSHGRSNDAPPISTMPLRASPIQDMPTDHVIGGQNDTSFSSSTKRSEETVYNASQVQSTPTLMSIATPVTPAPAPAIPPLSTVPPTPEKVPAPVPASSSSREEVIDQLLVEATNTHSPFSLDEPQASDENNADESDDPTLIEQIQTVVSTNTTLPEATRKAPDNALLLNIVQSLPPMTSPPQPQVRNGRATRSLGSVLLEGHLVPQNRLEVAQGIQRMLRGVDMNYQLGEILLMFKLLTPDQLLAASLVSYSLITATQISALGRIRQELHSIGLEYDLENLLILFRILTSEQLREVKISWLG